MLAVKLPDIMAELMFEHLLSIKVLELLRYSG